MNSSSKPFVVFEHQPLIVGQRYQGLEFKEKHRRALELHFGRGDSVSYFRLIHNGVQFNEFVGVLQVANLVIEVLPKADRVEQDTYWRNILVEMLRVVGAFNIQAPTSSRLSTRDNFILDLYFILFVEEVETLLHAGLVKKYRKKEANTSALKGALQFSHHLSKNLIHKERFYTRHTVYDKEHLLNQILLKTLDLLQKINRNPDLQSRISTLMLHFPELERPKITEYTFKSITYNRNTKRYQNAIEISRLLLLNYHPDLKSGQNDVLAIMFNMNELWEKFVYLSVRKFAPKNLSVQSQKSAWFWRPVIGSRMSVIPDILIRGAKENLVLDTKWKNIEVGNPSVDDLRQMYVYSKIFQANKVALVYPGSGESNSGCFYKEITQEGVNQEISYTEECGIIQISPQEDITMWQKNIADQIFKGWLGDSPSVANPAK